MNLSKKLLRRFVKDFNLPIQCMEHFWYYVNTYSDDDYSVDLELKMFKEVLEQCSPDHLEADFFKMSEDIANEMINFIKSQSAYQDLINYDISKFQQGMSTYNIPRKDIFKVENDKKRFISIDLNKANFQALKYFNPALVNSCKSWEAFMGSFCNDLDYYKKAKRYRQVVFGNVNPKRQQIIQKFMTRSLIDDLVKGDVVKPDQFVSWNADEVVIAFDDSIDLQKLRLVVDQSKFDFSIEIFTLQRMNPHNFYVKKFDDGRIEFKCVPVHYFMQVYKTYLGYKILDVDLDFYFEKQLARFQKPLEWE